jgi:plastocyanin
VADDLTLTMVAQQALVGRHACAVAFNAGRVCALTCGGQGSLECFTLGASGSVQEASTSYFKLDARNSFGNSATAFSVFEGPGDVVFTPNGDTVLAIIKSTGLYGWPWPLTVGQPLSNGAFKIPSTYLPVGLAVRTNGMDNTAADVYVSEALSPSCPLRGPFPNQTCSGPGLGPKGQQTPGPGAVSRYIYRLGAPPVLQERVNAGSFALCWIQHYRDHLYASTFISSTVDTFAVDGKGNITLLQNVPSGGPLGSTPLNISQPANPAAASIPVDLAVAEVSGQGYLFVRTFGYGSITTFKVDGSNGRITYEGQTPLPNGWFSNSVGIAATLPPLPAGAPLPLPVTDINRTQVAVLEGNISAVAPSAALAAPASTTSTGSSTGSSSSSTPATAAAPAAPATPATPAVTAVPSGEAEAVTWMRPTQLGNINIKAGQSVTWFWEDSLPHTVMFLGAAANQFDQSSPGKGPAANRMAGVGFSVTFNFPTAGSYPFQCGVHGPLMQGTVVVT